MGLTVGTTTGKLHLHLPKPYCETYCLVQAGDRDLVLTNISLKGVSLTTDLPFLSRLLLWKTRRVRSLLLDHIKSFYVFDWVHSGPELNPRAYEKRTTMCLKSYLHGTKRAFIPERVHSISIYIYIYLYLFLHDTETKFCFCSNQSIVISFRFATRMKFSFWFKFLILVSCKMKTNFC